MSMANVVYIEISENLVCHRLLLEFGTERSTAMLDVKFHNDSANKICVISKRELTIFLHETAGNCTHL